jgi:hypothetical protein
LSDTREKAPPYAERHHGWLWMLSLFLVGLGARLWLIYRCGTPLPFWDQWEEARVVYAPYFEGRLSLAELFAAHNEHRMFFNRFYDLALLLLNGQWDNQVEMVANAFIYSVGITGFGWIVARLIGRKFWPVIILPLMLALALPFGWENTLGGFHSQVYFGVLFSLGTIWLLGCHEPGSRQWGCGVVAAVCSLCVPTSGIISNGAICALVGLKLLRQPLSWKQRWPTLAVCFVLVALGLALRVEVPHHRVLMAHSVTEFLDYLGKYLAWPWIVLAPFAIFNLFPLLLLAWFYLRDRQSRMPAEELVLAVGLWTVLQAAATAYARGAQMYPQWRYMDCTCFVMVVNCLSIALLMSRHLGRRRPMRALWLAGFILWGVACTAGLVLLNMRAWSFDIPERQLYFRAQLQNTRAYMATDDIRVLDHKPNPQLPLYEGDPNAPRPQHEGEKLVRYLSFPRVRSILPACVRDPLKVVPQTAAGFVTNGAAGAKLAIPGEVSWGSYTSDGRANQGRFESLPIPRSGLPFLEFRVAGDLGQPGLSLTLIELDSGKTTSVRPLKALGNNWQTCRVRAPHGDFRIIAIDESDSGWFAFQAPREVGWLSWAAVRVASFGGTLFFVGLALYVAGVAFAFRLRRGSGFLRRASNPEKPASVSQS